MDAGDHTQGWVQPDISIRASDLARIPGPEHDGGDDYSDPGNFSDAVDPFISIITEVCAKRLRCCNQVHERNWDLGPPIKSVEDCVSVARGLLDNGAQPSFIELPVPLLDIVFDLKDRSYRLLVRPEGVSACANQVRDDASCPGARDASARCTPNTSTADACAVANLVTGLGELNEACMPNHKVQTCALGTVCRRVGPEPPKICGPCDGVTCLYCPPPNPRAPAGVCSPKASEGDACANDTDCDDLFCNPSSRQCAARAKLGEACAYQNENLTTLETSVDCETPLACDPLRHVCVASCSEGALCQKHADCSAGFACDFAALRDRGDPATRAQVGVCGSPLAEGAICADTLAESAYGFALHESACADGTCNVDSLGVGHCVPSAPPFGSTCLVLRHDPMKQEVLVECPGSTVCNHLSPALEQSDIAYPYYARFACVPRAALNESCVNGTNAGCENGLYCGINGTCTPRNLTSGGSCTTDRPGQCIDGEWCEPADNPADPGLCIPYSALGERCRWSGESSCGPKRVCFEEVCAAPIALGAACSWMGVPCVDGTFCTALVGGTGVCEAPRTLGEACDPVASQCEAPRRCYLREGVYRCGPSPSDVLCDGIQ